MFQKNLEALKSKNPELAARLGHINLKNIKEIAVYEAKSGGFIITYKDIPLHDTTDPVREAKATWNKTITTELKRNDIQLVFGLGLGYLFKRAYVSANSKIFVFEPFIKVLRYVLEYVDFSNEISDNRVYITDDYDDLMNKIKNEYLSGDKIEFLFLNSYVALAKDKLVKLSSQVLNICESRNADQNTIFNQCKDWTINSIKNIPYFCEARPLGEFEEKFLNKPALIISSGPSLRDDIDKIKENQNKFITIAAGSVLRTLIESGIIPDFVVFADPNYLMQHIEGLEDYLPRINLVVSSRADNCVFYKNFKSKLIYFSETDPVAEWLNDIDKSINIGLYKSGGTVSIQSYYFAKALGCSPIAFAGLDLAFVDNKIYADGTKLKLDSKGSIDLGYNPAYANKKLIEVTGHDGKTVRTRDDYAVFIRHFEEIFADQIDNVRIINTSLNGALINGMEYMTFADFIKLLCPQDLKIDSIISETFNQTKTKWLKFNEQIKQNLELQKKDIQQINFISIKIKTELQEICNLFKENSDDNYYPIENKINLIKSTINDVRKRFIENVFLSYYFQAEIWQYTQAYKINILPSIGDVKHNMNVELDFYTKIFNATHTNQRTIISSLEKYQEYFSTILI